MLNPRGAPSIEVTGIKLSIDILCLICFWLVITLLGKFINYNYIIN